MNGQVRPTPTELWLGIDLGTQSVKAEIVSRDGELWGSGQAPLTSVRDGGRHEQDPLEWISAVSAALEQALLPLNLAARSAIRGLAMCSTSGTLATVDAAGSPNGPGIMYDDARGAPLLAAVLAADEQHWAKSGPSSVPSPRATSVAPQPSWAVTKLAWLAQAGLPAGASAVAHQGDVVAAAMTGGPVATDWSSALKSGYDLGARRWPAEVFTGIGLDVSLLPPVVAPGTRIGITNATWEARTGLPQGTPVFAGTTDGCAGQFGAGALGLGSWHSVVGTTLVIKGVTYEPVTDEDAGVYSHLAPEGESWLPGGASSVGAGALSAYLPAGSDLAALTAEAREVWTSGPLPVAYPLVSPGERFPLSAPDFAGFLLPSTGGDAAQNGEALPLSALSELDAADALTAIFVGVAAVERLCFERLGVLAAPESTDTTVVASDIGRLSTSGGGARNLDWVRLRASMLGLPITRLSGAEGSLGMAALAAWGAARELDSSASLAQIAEHMSAVLDVVLPDPALTPPLNAVYRRFREQVEASRKISAQAEEAS